MTGMNRTTGEVIDGDADLRQSVADILITPIGSCVGMRDYGSMNPDLIDQPANRTTALRLYASTALAISRWEKRLRLMRVQLVAGDRPGAAVIHLEGIRTDRPKANSRTQITVPLSSLLA